MKSEFKLNKKVKEKWVKALKSDKYIQSSGRLKIYHSGTKNYSFCCLGVAREIKLCKRNRICYKEYVSFNFLPKKNSRYFNTF